VFAGHKKHGALLFGFGKFNSRLKCSKSPRNIQTTPKKQLPTTPAKGRNALATSLGEVSLLYMITQQHASHKRQHTVNSTT
jgi:hypothetical protein